MNAKTIRKHISIIFDHKENKGLKNYLSISNGITSFLLFNFFWITNRFREKFKDMFKNWIELELVVNLEYYLEKT